LNPAEARDGDGGPVFEAPWQANAFAMTLALHQRGVFTWTEWASTLAAEITRAQAAGDPDDGSTYYRHWLSAIERLVVDKGVVTPAHLDARRAAWHRAADATPHGRPIVLENDPQF
jgi:nitrile hydratase accessory protein